jgi:hypothetical protein
MAEIRLSLFPTLPAQYAVFNLVNIGITLRYDPIAIFPDLSGKSFSGDEKEFFVRQCLREFGEPGEFLDITFGATGRHMKRRYNIASGTVNGWVGKYRKSANQYSKAGHPGSIDPQGIRDFVRDVYEGKKVTVGRSKPKVVKLTRVEVEQCLNKHALETKRRRGHEVDDDVVLCPNTIKKLKKVCVNRNFISNVYIIIFITIQF